MLHHLHLWGSYGFVLVFVTSVALGISAVRRKDTGLERACAWSFLAAFAILLLTYWVAFPLKAEMMLGAPEATLRLLEKHHNMAKFAITGMILISSACATVLYRYREDRFPNWFLPNLLFLSLMVITFLVRTLISAYRLPI